MEEIVQFLKAAGVYYLATVEGDQPRVRPFGTATLFENKIYIQTGKIKKVADQMKANPKIEICAFNKGSWIRISGEAVLDERTEAQEAVLNDYPGLKNRYQVNDGNTEVYYIKNGVARFCSFTQPEREVRF